MTHKQKVLRLLSDRQPHTHHELYQLGCVAHSRISDLRRDGHKINKWREGDLYLYQLVGSLNEPDVPVRDGGAGSLSVPPPADDSVATVPSPVEGGAGTLILFECEIDESAGMRGAYGDAAA